MLSRLPYLLGLLAVLPFGWLTWHWALDVASSWAVVVVLGWFASMWLVLRWRRRRPAAVEPGAAAGVEPVRVDRWNSR